MTANKLKSVCENVARVHEVDMRRGRIADVQFDVDIQEMNDLLNRFDVNHLFRAVDFSSAGHGCIYCSILQVRKSSGNCEL